jgi:hypothetical protein
VKPQLKFMILIITISILFTEITGCSTKVPQASVNTISQNGITSNIPGKDIVMQMQQKVPFTIVIPTYIPDEFKTLPIQLHTHMDEELGVILDIDYFSLKSARQISFEEYSQPESLNQDVLRANLPDYTILDIEGIQILENKILSESVWNEHAYQDYAYTYIWMRNKTYFLGSLFKFHQIESRKIIESMINQK